ncbi:MULTISPECIES: hypothetical protein [Dyella]|uniref:Carbohydrate-binding family V/XII n=2 Tax=Dyella TaxID=231454 RepID=A0A4R0YWG8_9GAMM|nr:MULTISPECIES: hypothetical protein [Dyella]TBR39523.1 hypothetical protein EYV96_04745 [Dyella terrae]TCI12891.1 hypothetical protein EZM97_06125 [Dyella soli]
MLKLRYVILVLILVCTGGTLALAQQPHPTPSASAANAPRTGQWPRTYDVSGQHLVIHQPQLDSWEGNQLKGRAAVAVRTGTVTGSDGKQHDKLSYGVMWFSARTDTDKMAHTVALSNLTVEKVSFPTDTARQDTYLAALREIAKRGGQVVSLDTLQASLVISQQMKFDNKAAVKNDPPDIVFAFQPALLVLIDGKPVFKSSGVTGVSRVINTRSLVLEQGGKYYLAVAGRWMTASSLQAQWTSATSVSPALEQAKKQAVDAKLVDVLDQPPPALKTALDRGVTPEIVLRSSPTELIQFDGEPQFDAVPNTQLAYASNTGSDVFVDQGHDGAWYVLISGRWFTSNSTNGPWRFVDGRNLPPDFAKIPSDSPKSAVLASIPDTPEARESLIANAIPQTASVNRKQAKLQLTYDGQPQFKPIDGTSLSYAWNTAVPVIKVTDVSYFAVQNGVWFTSGSPNGPWAVALSVPSVIYAIPPSSPLYYVTYVRVYGYDGDTVYVGYTPGYYGTVVSDGVVVYGTGYACNPWVADYWYGCPATYGFGVAFGWDPWVGWSFGFAWGMAWSSAWYGPWWGPWGYWGGYYPYYPGYWGGGIAVANVYGRWGNSVVQGQRAAWADPWTGNYGRGARGGYYNEATGGRGVGRAGVNTNIYTGTTTAAAAGIRYNPQTGRVVAGQGGAAVNPYTGNAVAGGSRTTVNTETGRVTQSAGAAGRTDQGAGAAGAFNTQGAGGNAKGAGYVTYDRASGEVNRGGVVAANDSIYAGKDGNVYKYDKDNGWQPVDKPAAADRAQRPDTSNIDADRVARDRGADVNAARNGEYRGGSNFERSNYDNRYQGRMGGYRERSGGGRFGGGGGMRMGGGRRR